MKTVIKLDSFKDVRELRDISIETFSDTYKDPNSPLSFQAYVEKVYHVEQLFRELVHPFSFFFFIYFQRQVARRLGKERQRYWFL